MTTSTMKPLGKMSFTPDTTDKEQEMTLTETVLDPDTLEDGMGTLLITDMHLIVDVEHPGSLQTFQHWKNRAANILGLGNDMGLYTTHIISPGSASVTSRWLDNVFSDFVNACCYSLGCDAEADYIVGDGIIRRLHKEYGWDDGSYTMHLRVYCDSAGLGLLDKLKSEVALNVPLIVVSPDPSRLGYEVHKFSLDPASVNAST